MIKINPVKVLPKAEQLKPKKTPKIHVDLSGEDKGYYKIDGKIVRIIYPR